MDSKEHILHIGCSSYATRSWQPLFFPDGLPTKEWFGYYCRYFNTYELNSTFYRFPRLKTLQGWYEKAPDDFFFSIKVPKVITHIKRLEDCAAEIDKFYDVARNGLKTKLGCILFQLPPSFTFSEERLETVIESVNPQFTNVVEFRHQSWWRQDVFEAFIRSNITFCSVDYPKLPNEVIRTSSTGYVRMHGNPKLFYSEYTTDQIKSIIDQVKDSGFKQAFIYFNNTASTAGIVNAIKAKKLAV